MNRIAIVTLSIIICLMVLAGMAVAQETALCLRDLCPACTPTLNCPEIPACPACNPTLTCAEDVVTVPGLWEVTTNKRLCGEIVLGPSWVIINNETLMLNKVKKMVKVESCD